MELCEIHVRLKYGVKCSDCNFWCIKLLFLVKDTTFGEKTGMAEPFKAMRIGRVIWNAWESFSWLMV